MEIQKITISKQDRGIVSVFMGEEHPFEIDFNWLMHVVEKINNDFNYEYEVNIIGNRCYIEGFSAKAYEGKTSIEATYKEVIEFIKWYNSQNK